MEVETPLHPQARMSKYLITERSPAQFKAYTTQVMLGFCTVNEMRARLYGD